MLENRLIPHGEKLADYAARLELTREDFSRNWLNEVQFTAAEVIKEKGFPHSKLESWEFSQVRKVLSDTYSGSNPRVSREQISEALNKPLARTGLPSLVFVNGSLDPEFSDLQRLPEGLRLIPLEKLEQNKDVYDWIRSSWVTGGQEKSFKSLNLMLTRDPAVLYAEPGIKVKQEIQILFLSIGSTGDRSIVNPGTFLFAGEDSEVSIIETHIGLDGNKYLSNAHTMISGRKNSVVKHVKVIAENSQAFHLGCIRADLESGTSFKTNTIVRSGKIVRNEVETALNGENAGAELYGLYLAEDTQHVENSTCIEHNKPECISREHYKGILNDKSRAVFRGRIVVAEDAQKTDSEQNNNNLLLSRDARVNSKPQLEIYADDVSCTHGATVGQLEDEKIFYLQSRGISLQEANALLIRAFGNEIISRIDSEPLRLVLEEEILSAVAGN
jgi:Fe-S cluster assembly protein SufD